MGSFSKTRFLMILNFFFCLAGTCHGSGTHARKSWGTLPTVWQRGCEDQNYTNVENRAPRGYRLQKERPHKRGCKKMEPLVCLDGVLQNETSQSSVFVKFYNDIFPLKSKWGVWFSFKCWYLGSICCVDEVLFRIQFPLL